MACQVIGHSWTFSGLVGAFLDLVIAYLLLCCSTIAFFIGKFLALFGLSLPCPCNGLFGYPYHGPCLQKLLVDCPAESLSSVQLSIKSKFPFDAILAKNDQNQLNLKLVRQCNFDDGGLEFEGEASYSSFSDPRRSQQSLSGSDSFSKFDHKGKGTTSQRQRCGFRRRRRGSLDCGRLTSGSSYDNMRSDVRVVRRSPSDPSKIGGELNAQSFHDVQDTSVGPVRTLQDFEAIDAMDENKLIYDNATSFEILKHKLGHGHGLDCHDENAVMILEQALEIEQSARAALCTELEQERIAAATAADEAMAMISRLQEEKASIEIEARQYQRILEEKSAYDAEEMDILKEIIVRRERETHFLEKEIEEYRKSLQENEGSECQVEDTQGYYDVWDSSVDPMLFMPQPDESIDKQGNVSTKNNYSDFSSEYVEKQTSAASLSKQLPLAECRETKMDKGKESPESLSIVHDGDEASQEIQEKGILSVEEMLFSQFCKSKNSQLHEFCGDNSTLVRESVSNDNILKTDIGEVQMQISEPHVHDVHIVASKCNSCNKGLENRVDSFMPSSASYFARKCDLSSEASNSQKVDDLSNGSRRLELGINRSCSDVVDRFSSLSSSPSRSVVSEQRRNSLSAVDQERLKIDSEVGCLRARLRAVQKEKEKLKSSLESQERGKIELRLLEDIAALLREIRHLRKPEKAARQASLPPLSSKETSKRRRSRSTSVGVGQSAST